MKYTILDDDRLHLNEHYYLRRIQAIKDFGDIKAGDLGGYVEGEHNLAQQGKCWIYDEACVYGKAHVKGAAKVRGKARVGDEAKVYGFSEVSDNAHVFGRSYLAREVRIRDNAVVDSTEFTTSGTVEHDAEISYSRVSFDVRVCGRARVTKSTLRGNVVIKDRACLRDASVGGNVTIKDRAAVLGTVSGDGVVVCDDALVDEGAQIVGAPGTVICIHIPPGFHSSFDAPIRAIRPCDVAMFAYAGTSGKPICVHRTVDGRVVIALVAHDYSSFTFCSVGELEDYLDEHPGVYPPGLAEQTLAMTAQLVDFIQSTSLD